MLLFQENLKNAKQQFNQYKKQSNMIALIRFLLICIVIIGLLVGYFQKLSFLYVIAFLCFFIFMALVMYHDRLKQRCAYYQALSNVYQEHRDRSEGKWRHFKNDGLEFIELHKELSDDLDIFGKHSLFQMMNIAFTQRGQRKLADALLQTRVDIEQIEKCQEAVLELSQQIDFVIQIQTYGKMISHFQENRIDNFIKHKNIKSKNQNPILLYILPIMTILAFVLTLLKIGFPYTYMICEIGFVMQLCIAFITIKKHSQNFEPICRFDKGMQGYLSLFTHIHKGQFQSSLLKDIQVSLFEKSDVLKGIEELSKISQRVSYRQNIFAFLFLNGFLSFDLILEYQYNKWLSCYYEDIDDWFEQLAKLELYMSLSVLKIDEFDVTMPTLIKSHDLQLSFHNLRHPLLYKDKVIGNDFKVSKHVNIITGSNMSGKTTFMRTIALNLVLAYAGGYVFADDMVCSYMHILSSMRVKDNVEEGISTFYGELLRIKEMVLFSQQQVPMICFIDEIFKGTNSLDRIAGAKATIQKLSLPYGLMFLTTHDFELCQIDHLECQNYHFDEYYEDEHIYFDYRIKEGQSQSTNGQFLLRQLGIMEDE